MTSMSGAGEVPNMLMKNSGSSGRKVATKLVLVLPLHPLNVFVIW